MGRISGGISGTVSFHYRGAAPSCIANFPCYSPCDLGVTWLGLERDAPRAPEPAGREQRQEHEQRQARRDDLPRRRPPQGGADVHRHGRIALPRPPGHTHPQGPPPGPAQAHRGVVTIGGTGFKPCLVPLRRSVLTRRPDHERHAAAAVGRDDPHGYIHDPGARSGARRHPHTIRPSPPLADSRRPPVRARHARRRQQCDGNDEPDRREAGTCTARRDALTLRLRLGAPAVPPRPTPTARGGGISHPQELAKRKQAAPILAPHDSPPMARRDDPP